MTRVALVGAAGRMGQAIGAALAAAPSVDLVAMIDPREPADTFGATSLRALSELTPSDVDVVVEFSTHESAVATLAWCDQHHRHAVVGTTGFTSDDLATRQGALEGADYGVVIAANFAVGAVLSQRFAAQAAPYFDRVEIIEYHHDQKIDAPSGTALETARQIAAAREAAGLAPLVDPTTKEVVPGSRGATSAGGIAIHAVRLPGLVAHQEILFGRAGEGLTLRHDSYDRASFAGGVLLAVTKVAQRPGLTIGLEPLL